MGKARVQQHHAAFLAEQQTRAAEQHQAGDGRLRELPEDAHRGVVQPPLARVLHL